MPGGRGGGRGPGHHGPGFRGGGWRPGPGWGPRPGWGFWGRPPPPIVVIGAAAAVSATAAYAATAPRRHRVVYVTNYSNYAPSGGGTASASTGKQFYVQIPEGVQPGDHFKVSLDGIEFDVLCPEGAVVGETIIVTAPRGGAGGFSTSPPPYASTQAPPTAAAHPSTLSGSAPPLAYAETDSGPVMAEAVVLSGSTVSCSACTFENHASNVHCEMCTTLLSSGTVNKSEKVDITPQATSTLSWFGWGTPAPAPAPAAVAAVCDSKASALLPPPATTAYIPAAAVIASPPQPPTSTAGAANSTDTAGIDDSSSWAVSPSQQAVFLDLFYQNGGRPGVPVSSDAAFAAMESLTALRPVSRHVMARLWVLADADGDDALNEVEWVAAMVLLRWVSDEHALPTKLPAQLMRGLP